MIKSLLEKNKDFAILITRIGVGSAFLFVHGWGKIMQGPELWTKIGSAMNNIGITYVHVFWGFMASLSEFGGGILLILGLFTRTASSFMAFTMVVGAINHFSKLDPWNRVIYPIEMFLILFLFIFLGGGKYSLDNLLFGRKKTELS